MGYYFAMSPCFGCKNLFSYNPELVPSVRVNGVREPICANCVKAANPEREKRGLAKIEVLPGAYEAAEEGGL